VQPTSPVQGSKIPAKMRIPVRPNAGPSGSDVPASAGLFGLSSASTLSLPAYIPSSAPESRTESTPTVYVPSSRPLFTSSMIERRVGQVAESLMKNFKYTPEDTTPPKRKISVVTEAAEGMGDDEADLLPKSETGPTASCSPQQGKQSASSPSPRLHTARIALMGDIGHTATQASANVAALATSDPSKVSSSGSLFEDAQASKTALNVALESERKMDDAEHASIRKLPYARVRDPDPLMVEGRLRAANLGVRLREVRSKHELLSSVSDESTQEAVSKLPSIDEHAAQHMQTPGISGNSNIIARSASTAPQRAPWPRSRSLDSQTMTEARWFQRSAEASASGARGSTSSRERTIARPVQTVPTQRSPSEQGKRQTTTHPRCWVLKGRIIATITAVLISLGFIAGSNWRLAATPTFNVALSSLRTSVDTITSDDGSSNLTISWVNGRAVGFNATYSLNTTLPSAAEEAAPDFYAISLHWSQSVGYLDTEDEGEHLKAVPIPSFGEVFVHLGALLGLFSIIYLLLHFFLSWASRCWHTREETGIFLTSEWLRSFDKVRGRIAFVVSAVVTALVWACVTRKLLSI
jgi:hypothetical protein